MRREQRADEVETVLNQLFATESLLFREFNDVSDRLGEQLEDRALETRMAAVLDELSDTQSALSAATNAEDSAALLERLDQLDQQLRTLQLALNIELEQPDVASLVSEREDIEVRLAAIQQLRIQIEAESAASGSGLAFLSTPTVEGTSGSVFTAVATSVGAFLGLFAGLAAAYLLSTSRQSFHRPEEPQGVLGVPYLADIPKFEEVGSEGPLPVVSDPRSPAAESFRFVAASLGFRANRAEAKIIVAVSGSVGEGKSTIIANTALAAARSGKRVLLWYQGTGLAALPGRVPAPLYRVQGLIRSIWTPQEDGSFSFSSYDLGFYGDLVTGAPLSSFEKNRLLVAVQIFGRSTPVELEFSQVEKA